MWKKVMEQKKLGAILLLCRACHWTLCHISAGASSSLVVERCARAICLLLCLFWKGLGISCTFGLQPKTALISIANENVVSVQQPISPWKGSPSLPLSGTAWSWHWGFSAGSEWLRDAQVTSLCPVATVCPRVRPWDMSSGDAPGRLDLALSVVQAVPKWCVCWLGAKPNVTTALQCEWPLAQLTGPIVFGWMSPHLSSMFMSSTYSLEVGTPCVRPGILKGYLDKEMGQPSCILCLHWSESSRYDLVLAQYREVNLGVFSLEQALVKAVNTIIITEYVQALLTTSRKPSSVQRRMIVSKIEEDHRMLQTVFKECLVSLWYGYRFALRHQEQYQQRKRLWKQQKSLRRLTTVVCSFTEMTIRCADGPSDLPEAVSL